jgi:hypothetical protein
LDLQSHRVFIAQSFQDGKKRGREENSRPDIFLDSIRWIGLEASTISAATATAATTAVSATATAATRVLSRTSFVDRQRTAIMFGVVEIVDRVLRVLSILHFDESETLAPAGIAILDHLSAPHSTKL